MILNVSLDLEALPRSHLERKQPEMDRPKHSSA